MQVEAHRKQHRAPLNRRWRFHFQYTLPTTERACRVTQASGEVCSGQARIGSRLLCSLIEVNQSDATVVLACRSPLRTPGRLEESIPPTLLIR